MGDAALIAWADENAAPHATGESTDPNGLKNEIAKRVELIMSVMPGDWPRRIRDDQEIRGIFEANPCVPVTTAQIAKQAAAEYVVTPRVRR